MVVGSVVNRMVAMAVGESWRRNSSIAAGIRDIPADQIVLISPAAANHDPARYDNPQALDLHRDAASHLAFGHGIHYCLGARLARAETEIALSTIVQRFPGLQLAVSDQELQWRHSRLFRSLEALRVRW